MTERNENSLQTAIRWATDALVVGSVAIGVTRLVNDAITNIVIPDVDVTKALNKSIIGDVADFLKQVCKLSVEIDNIRAGTDRKKAEVISEEGFDLWLPMFRRSNICDRIVALINGDSIRNPGMQYPTIEQRDWANAVLGLCDRCFKEHRDWSKEVKQRERTNSARKWALYAKENGYSANTSLSGCFLPPNFGEELRNVSLPVRLLLYTVAVALALLVIGSVVQEIT